MCQRRPCADQHGHSARRTAWTSPSRRPTEKYHRRSRSRPRPCRPRPGGRLCSRTTQRTRSRTTGPRGGGGPAVRGTCVRWHSRCGPGARRKRLAVRFSPTWRCGDCAFSTNANVRIVLTSHCRFLNVTEVRRCSHQKPHWGQQQFCLPGLAAAAGSRQGGATCQHCCASTASA